MRRKGKVTFEERIEIVKYCIENNRDFNKTFKFYQFFLLLLLGYLAYGI